MQFEPDQYPAELQLVTTVCVTSKQAFALHGTKEERESVLRLILEKDPNARGAWIDELKQA